MSVSNCETVWIRCAVSATDTGTSYAKHKPTKEKTMPSQEVIDLLWVFGGIAVSMGGFFAMIMWALNKWD